MTCVCTAVPAGDVVGSVIDDTRQLLRRVLISLWERLLPQLTSAADLGLPPSLERLQLAATAAEEQRQQTTQVRIRAVFFMFPVADACGSYTTCTHCSLCPKPTFTMCARALLALAQAALVVVTPRAHCGGARCSPAGALTTATSTTRRTPWPKQPTRKRCDAVA